MLYLQLSIEDAMKRGGFGQERYEKVEAQTVVKQIYEEKLRDETWQVSDLPKVPSLSCVVADFFS